jgi:hypothetical protein
MQAQQDSLLDEGMMVEVRQAVEAVANEQAVVPDARVKALEMLQQIAANILSPPLAQGQHGDTLEAARTRYGRLKTVSGPYKRTLAPLPSAVLNPRRVLH